MEENSQFREVFNRESVSGLAERIKSVYADFKFKSFINFAIKNFVNLSLSERNLQISKALKKFLPGSFPEAVEILLKALPVEIEEEELEGSRGFIIMPQSIFIAKEGMEYFELSMYALEEMTKRFTSEFAIRFFLIEYPEKTLEQMKKWAVDENCHVRRLASEGSRPLLPWAMRLHDFVKDPKPVFEILELMKFSQERLVQRSIANNLNDISKNQPDQVTSILSKWQKEGVSEWLITHALRTLFKQGNPEALKLNGYNPELAVELTNFNINTPTVKFGEFLEFSFEINSKKPEKLMIDFIIHHMKANGKRAPKVFKLAKKTVSGEIKIDKKHAMKPISTRKYYPGKHLLQIQINGKVLAEKEFVLKMDS